MHKFKEGSLFAILRVNERPQRNVILLRPPESPAHAELDLTELPQALICRGGQLSAPSIDLSNG